MDDKKILKKGVPFLDGIQDLLHGKCDCYILNNEREIFIEDAIFHYIDGDLQTRKSEIILSAIWVNQKGTTYRRVTEKDIIEDLEEKLFLENLKNHCLINIVNVGDEFQLDGKYAYVVNPCSRGLMIYMTPSFLGKYYITTTANEQLLVMVKSSPIVPFP